MFADTTEWVVPLRIGGAEVSELTHVLGPSLSYVYAEHGVVMHD